MKQIKKIISNNNEIDLYELMRQLWKQKIIILLTSLFFLAAGYLYGTLQPKIYKTEIILREADSSLFKSYDILLNKEQQQKQQQQQQGIVAQFNEEVKLKLLSLDTLIQFVENNNKISNFKNHLKEKDISVKKYFKGKFQLVVDKKNIQNRYSLAYSPPLPGEIFLNDYILFAQQQALITFKDRLIKLIIAEIDLYNQQLKIADSINLKNPILKSVGESDIVFNELNTLFYKGSIVLSQEIFYLNKILSKTKDLTLDYNPILEQASYAVLISASPEIFAFIAFFFGLFLSSIIILIRNIKNK
jgi:LPS O-antigen subunit length determinant protein (WzzB/FepE family)